MAALEISPAKVAYVIIRAREYAAKVGAWDDSATSDHDAESILEDFTQDATQAEIKSFIGSLNEDEQASLVALAWIGRGSFGPEELDEALATARAEHINRTEDYLLGIPLLADYLEEGFGPAWLFGRRCRGRRPLRRTFPPRSLLPKPQQQLASVARWFVYGIEDDSITPFWMISVSLLR
jgi:Protein of unknown function (DUF3775)